MKLNLSRTQRRTLLTVHVVASVGLLGACAAIVLINVRAAATGEAALYELLSMFSFVFGIPLSFVSLISGIVLGIGSKWGVIRYRWVTVKLVLNVAVIGVGAFVIGPQTEAMIDQGGSQAVLIAASAFDVIALTLATTLSVFKPGRPRRATRVRHRPPATAA
jgi:hypothetical protein